MAQTISSHQFAVSDDVVVVPTGPQIPPVPPAARVRIPSQTNSLSPFVHLSLAKNAKYSPFSNKLAEESTDGKGREYVQQKSDSAYFSKPTPQADSDTLAIESGNNDEYAKSDQCQEDRYLQVQKESACPTEEPSLVGISTPTASTAKPQNTKERVVVGPSHVTTLSDPTVKRVPVSWHDTGQPNTAPSSATPGSDTSTATVTPRELLEPSTLKDRQTNGSPIFPPLASPSKRLTKTTQGHDTSAATRKQNSYDLPSPGEPLKSHLPDPKNSEFEEARQETPWECPDQAPEYNSQDETREEDRIYHSYPVRFFTKCVDNDPFRSIGQVLNLTETPSETHFTPQLFAYVQTVLPSQVSHFVSIPPFKDQPFRFDSEDSGYASNKLQQIN